MAVALGKAGNTAPGPDGITYAKWRILDKNGALLSQLFSKCQAFGKMPKTFKQYVTILCFKKGDPNEVSKWRPIALSNCLGKTICSIISTRLTKWAMANSLLSWEQKGFLPYEGCLKHNHELQELID